jgi:HTH-type transcriptional regulator / antitoxin HipB
MLYRSVNYWFLERLFMKNPPIGKVMPAAKVVKTVAEIGALAALARKSQGLGQSDVAGLSNCGVRFIVDLEKGKPTVRTQMVLQTLDLLGLELVIRAKGATQ